MLEEKALIMAYVCNMNYIHFLHNYIGFVSLDSKVLLLDRVFFVRIDFDHTWSYFTYDYDTNINIRVWHKWEVWLKLWL